ncbi:hypothetical protein [uncultured Chryseobacterium sp.]|jgi:hypothetical protein|uniref:hypothetical protein n=1 Tax=uncultured Chryseobacterium sp. TaxID=259322 RepID=UPI00260D2EFF|nr:hypothetical protein [uncultured Chryseobacterium sp.]
MTNYKQLWDKILKDINDDDIVLEIKISNTDIQDWNNILNLIYENFSMLIDFDNTSINLDEIKNLSLNYFPSSENDVMKYLTLNFKYFNLILTLYDLEQIEFFTDSVIKLKIDDIKSLFLFCESISESLSKNIGIYCEGYREYSILYNSKTSSWTY